MASVGSSSVLERVAKFITAHRTAIVVSSVLVAGSSAGYLYYTSIVNDNDKPKPKPKKLSKQEKKKLKKAKEAEGEYSLMMEMRSRSLNGHSCLTVAKVDNFDGFPLTNDGEGSPDYPVIEDFSQVQALPEESRKKLAALFKNAGNYSFNTTKDLEKAIEFYTSAIKCQEDAIFYSNRAACYTKLEKYDKVIEDTSKALEIKPDYIKCFSRRAAAYENLDNIPEALLDLTSTCILSSFEDQTFTNAVDRLLKVYAERLAQSALEKREKALPSANYITSYLNSFRPIDLPETIINAEEGSGDYQLKLAFEAIKTGNSESYDQAFKYFDNAIELNASDLALAYEYRSTFNFLAGDIEKALEDIEKSIQVKPSVLAYIKRSSIHMEGGNLHAAHVDFESALALEPGSSDVFYHRAQVAFLTNQYESAINDYKRSIELNHDFVLSHVQLAVTKYRMGKPDQAKEDFKELIKIFPNSSDVHNYYGEILMDLQEYPDAIKHLDRALEIEKKKKTAAINPLSLVNKALAVVYWKQDFSQAEELCLKAAALDPKSDITISTLAQLYLQQSKTEEALVWFEKNVKIVRTEPELVQLYSLIEAARTQLRVIKERPSIKQRLDILTRKAAMENR